MCKRVFCASAFSKSVDVSRLQDGDIIFHESASRQSPVIKIGQASRWTHCGIRPCEPTTLSKMGLDNRLVRSLASMKIGRDRVSRIKGDEPIVTPAQLVRSSNLRKVM